MLNYPVFEYEIVFPGTEYPHEARVLENGEVVKRVRFKSVENKVILQEPITLTNGQSVSMGEITIKM